MKPIPRKTTAAGKPAPTAKTTANTKAPTASAKGPTASAKGPTATVKGPTATSKGPTASAKGPTATAKGPTATAKGPTASAKGPTATAKTYATTGRAPIASTAKGPTATAKGSTATAKTHTTTGKTPTASSKAPTATAKTGAAKRLATGKLTATRKTAAAPRGATEAKGLRDLFEVGLKDIYYAEKVLARSLPKMVKNATSPALVNELNNHLNITKEQVSRLEQIFKSTGIKASAKKCDAMDGILKETDDMIQNTVKGNVRDAGIISSDQKVDHYEIASFGTLHAYAKTLGEHEAANLLSLTLDEAKKVDAALTRLAMTGINSQAWRADAITTIRK